ncbi:EKC/KEOPS complex subunit TPRKB-like [Mya arenaria]|uniref:EKC/KEOPS complex subunit TPRKB-like n=1 Tax=Mya arenaria TaxID=6604 RepID=UPI0022E4B02B|nr:EKC/KEOPS complex subunit TPRKB-like [Mya arenaria]
MPNYFKRDGLSFSLALFKDLKNAIDVKRMVMNGEFEATLLNTKMIPDPFIVITAANRAAYNQRYGKMVTKNVHSEVLFCLSPTKNITDSFKKFGMPDSADSVFVVLVNDRDNKVMEQLTKVIDGTEVDTGDVTQFTDESLIKKVYKVSDEELNCGSLTDALVSKIASKEFVTV